MTREEARERAMALFSEGYNCAQAVVGTFAQSLGFDFETGMKMSAPFGGGFGRLREVCGAVSGMCIVLGLSSKEFDPNDPEQKANVYRETQALIAAFQEKNGSYICRELLNGVKSTTGVEPEARTQEYYRKRPCRELVGDAAEILYDYLEDA